ERIEPIEHLAVEHGDRVGAHDAAEPCGEPLERMRGGAVITERGCGVEREVGRDRRQRAVAGAGREVGVALIAAFGLTAAQREEEDGECGGQAHRSTVGRSGAFTLQYAQTTEEWGDRRARGAAVPKPRPRGL